MTFKIHEVEPNKYSQHYYLEENDKIWCLGEYEPKNNDCSVNSFIHNLKKPVDRKGTHEWAYKINAISSVANNLSTHILSNPGTGNNIYWVPIPPSKMITDPLYDDRLIQILHTMISNVRAHYQNHFLANVLTQNSSRVASHISDERPKPEELMALYQLSQIPNFNEDKDIIILFDDLLTTGCHFKAASSKILEMYPKTVIKGCFIARRALNEEEN